MSLRLALAAIILAPALVAAEPAPTLESLAAAGMKMSEADLAAAQAKADADANDAEDRAKLLGYHMMHQDAAKVPLALWFIAHRPEDEVTGSFAPLNNILEPEGYRTGADLWKKNCAGKPSAAILVNAVNFFSVNDDAEADTLLRRGLADFPTDARFPELIGEADLRAGAGKEAEAQAMMEKALALTTVPEDRFALLTEVAKSAFANHDFAKARTYATHMVDDAATINDWNTGNAIHHGNLILGRIAVHDGDIPAACSYLLKAGQTKGSPQLDSFGPNMSLAKELLEKGERDTVIKYLDLCAVFWKSGKVAAWKSEISAGKVPDFGANLLY